ncbi:MAG: dockerin type I repeat-containing protein [Ruminococcus sp.]|nr:dockerin type I repeat-containing protein [Ruminococcus sp.]
MRKKYKKILATISAVAMCAVSATTISASAILMVAEGRVNEYTTSFNAIGNHGKIKYNFWQAGTDFLGWSGTRVFISEPIKYTDYETGEEKSYYGTMLCYNEGGVDPFWRADIYKCFSAEKGGVNEEKIELIAEYLTEKSIPYTIDESTYFTHITFDDENMDLDESMELATEIRKHVDWSFADIEIPDSVGVEVTDIENTLPAPTLLGDANEDGEVSLADAVFIMQVLSNPDEFQLTPQGMANADTDGDGVTVMDAFRIQEMMIE